MAIDCYELNWKDNTSNEKLWHYILNKVSQSKKVGLSFSANNRQSIELFHSYTNGKPTKSPVFGVVSGQALLIKYIADLIINTNNCDNIHILPISTIIVGGSKNSEKKIIPQYALRRDLTNIYNHAIEGWDIIILTNPKEWKESQKYQIGGGVAKHFYDDNYKMNYLKYPLQGDHHTIDPQIEECSAGVFVETVIDNLVDHFSEDVLDKESEDYESEKEKRKIKKQEIELNLLRRQSVGLTLNYYIRKYLNEKILKKDKQAKIESEVVVPEKGSKKQENEVFRVKISGKFQLKLEFYDDVLFATFTRKLKTYLRFYSAKILKGRTLVIPTKFLFNFLRKVIGIYPDVISNMIRYCFLVKEYQIKPRDYYWNVLKLAEPDKVFRDIYFTPTGIFVNIEYFICFEKLFTTENLNFHNKFKPEGKIGSALFQKFIFYYSQEENKLSPNSIQKWKENLTPRIPNIENYIKSSYLFKAIDLVHLFLNIRSDLFGFHDLFLSKHSLKNIILPNQEPFPVLLNPLSFFDTRFDRSHHFFKKLKFRPSKACKNITFLDFPQQLKELDDFFVENKDNLPEYIYKNPCVRLFEVEDGKNSVIEKMESIECNLNELVHFYYSTFTFVIVYQIVSPESDYKANLIENSLSAIHSAIHSFISASILSSSSTLNDFIKTIWFYNQIATICCFKGNFFLLSIIVDCFRVYLNVFDRLISSDFLSFSLPPENSCFFFDFYYFSYFLENEKERICVFLNDFQFVVIPSLKFIKSPSDPPPSLLFSKFLRFLPDAHDLHHPSLSNKFFDSIMKSSPHSTSPESKPIIPDDFLASKDPFTDHLIKYLSSFNYLSNIKHLSLYCKSFDNSVSLEFIEGFDPSKELNSPLDILILHSNDIFNSVFYHSLQMKDFDRINQILSFNLFRAPSSSKLPSLAPSDIFSDYSSNDYSILDNIIRFYFI